MAARKRQQSGGAAVVVAAAAAPGPEEPDNKRRRRSGRLSSSSAGQKSHYFEDGSEDETDDVKSASGKGKSGLRRGGRTAAGAVGSGRAGGNGGGSAEARTTASVRGRRGAVKEVEVEEEEDEDEDDGDDDGNDGDDDDDEEVYREDEDEEEEEDEEDEHDEEESKPKGRNANDRGGRRVSKQAVRNEPDEDEDEDEYEDEDDGSPKVTFIPHVKMRDTGGVEYADDRLHKNTLLFLRDLKANNKRDWLKTNDGEYRRSLKDWESFVETFTQKVIELDETVPELPVKDVVFRIYRDIRFSKDPTPYKPHYSAAWSRTGRKGPYACYYIHCEPGSAFVGGGLWHPGAGHLSKLRASIDERPRRWRRVLSEPAFRREFLPKAKEGDEKSILKAFALANAENALKVRPKGFLAEHRDIELLKLRNFTIGKKIPDSWLTDKDALDKLGEVVEAMVGFVSFLNDVVMPDLGADDESEEEEDEE